MARTIAEIQDEILIEKGKQTSLNGLTDSKAAIWKLWINIVATAIWVHEKIVEKNALISRPHTLNWYREQALNFHYGIPIDPDSSNIIPLIWKEGSYQFDTTKLSDTEIENAKIIKHCAVSEIDLGTVLDPNKKPEEIFSDYFHNKVGVVFIKVATVKDDKISRIDVPNELFAFKEYIAKIKDAGNQVHITSDQGDILQLKLNVYIDPLTIYIDPKDIEYYQLKSLSRDLTTQEKIKLAEYELALLTDPLNEKNGSLIIDDQEFPVINSIREHLKNIEFNGAFVKTYLVDAVQKAEGVKIPILTKVQTSVAKNPNDTQNPALTDATNIEYFIPKAGYFDMDTLEFEVNYIPYTFYRDKQ
ncbi:MULTISPECIES: hypothetical protein [unclassified Flavobacterium]|jgi:hypothetical protein|uniref:hypothetical protein n=1 Tax=unclassified Flavobacterium TaxID=196869 RepID=UPI0012A955BB|nr:MULTISPECIES: hypothetical protein [unclassified Flavobacterium]MBF4484351.1 hypothetical protein [Flavobacterium sp. CSZ]QGK72780.1 hypothetical protein GIY83_01450 [Flavobacterium sp. SLB02]